MPRHRRTPVSLYGVNRYASNDNRVSNSIKYRSGGYLHEPCSYCVVMILVIAGIGWRMTQARDQGPALSSAGNGHA